MIRLTTASGAPRGYFQSLESKFMVTLLAPAPVSTLEEVAQCHQLPLLLMDWTKEFFLTLMIKLDPLLVALTVLLISDVIIHLGEALDSLISNHFILLKFL